MILTLDFETKDPYIDRGLGGGWCYPKGDFKVLGVSAKQDEGRSAYYTDSSFNDDITLVKYLGQLAYTECITEIVMHNASYDLGCLKHLGIEVPKHVKIVDTMVMAKLFDNSLGLKKYNLDELSQRYLGKHKDNKLLADTVYKLDLMPYTKTELKQKEKSLQHITGSHVIVNSSIFLRKRDDKELIKWAKANMDILQDKAPEVVAKYANTDTQNTYELYCYFRDSGIDMELVYKYSKLARVVTDYRAKGVRIDLEAADYAKRMLDVEIITKLESVYRLAAEEFNVSSPNDVARVLEAAGLKLPMTGKGNKSATGPWLEKQNHPLCQAIVDARKVLKMKNDFVQKIIEMQEFTCPGAAKYGRIHPQLNLMEAITGRFSCSNPNVQQIPSRDSRYSQLIKAIFIPEDGEQIYDLDYSNQEGRIMVHFSYLKGCTGASEYRLLMNNDPNFDMYAKISNSVYGMKQDPDEFKVARYKCKTGFLAIAYGAGGARVCTQLGLPTRVVKGRDGKDREIAGPEGQALIDGIHKAAPFLKELSNVCQEIVTRRGFLKTLKGRHVRVSRPSMIEGKHTSYEYTALNSVIQGSAFDQTAEAMLQAYDEGIPVLFPVHDEILMSSTLQQALRMKEIMETCCNLEVPVVVGANLKGGKNWAEGGH